MPAPPFALAAALAAAATPTALAAPQSPAPQPYDAAPEDWRAIPADELLVMTLANGHRIVIRLAPAWAPTHVANLRALARAHWWDGTSVYRVQDNYVAQWGGGDAKTALPQEIVTRPPAEYVRPGWFGVTRPARPDAYAARTGHSADGWPVASDGRSSWLPHCYAMVAVARDLAPSTGSGSELYTMIGHAPRHLDRNLAVVGRIIEGIEWLSTLPRGTEALGFYKTAAENMPIASVRLASDLPEGERPRFEYRATDNARFRAWVHMRENREPPFFEVPAGGADICNMMPPVRRAP